MNTTNANYQMPVNAIRRIVLEELDSKVEAIYTQSVNARFDDEFKEAIHVHRAMVEALDSHEAFDNYLSVYRRISLADWIGSL